jgi:hypothetical protein
VQLKYLVSATIAAMLSACNTPPEPTSSLGLDHILIFVSPGAPERSALSEAGFTIAPSVNRHDGQGTASVTVELLNAFLELVWVDSTVPVTPARREVQARFAKRADWRRTGWSPFGFALHRGSTAMDSVPVPARRITVEWMEPGTAMYILGALSDTLAASVSVHPTPVDEAANARALRSGKGKMFEHANGVRRLTSVDRVLVPSGAALAPTSRMLDSLGIARFETGAEWVLELSFDDRSQGVTRDLRPTLPLIVRY